MNLNYTELLEGRETISRVSGLRGPETKEGQGVELSFIHIATVLRQRRSLCICELITDAVYLLET